MPLTLAHPAAILPLHRAFGSRLSFSALVIGTMVPDFAYVFSIAVTREQSHSLAGVFWFGAPVGLATYLLFHLLLKEPLLALAPSIAVRCHRNPRARRELPGTGWLTIACSLLLGGLTHLCWDAFTHRDTAVTRALPILSRELGVVMHYQVTGYRILQHGSTLMGLLILLWVGIRWMRRTPMVRAKVVPITKAQRWMAIALLVGAMLVGGWRGFVAQMTALRGTDALQYAIGGAVKGALAWAGLAICVFAVAWRVWYRAPTTSTSDMRGTGS